MFRRGGLIARLVLALCACGAIVMLRSAAARTGPKTAIFVGNSNYVTAYPVGGKGDVTPLALTTDMISPGGIARDASGRIYVTNTPTNTVTIYAADAEGNVPPLAVIGGSATQLADPTGIALDGSGKIYVLNTGTNTITVYPPLDTGTGLLNEAPIATIAGPQAQLDQPVAIAVDTNGDIYVANQQGGPATAGPNYAPGVVTVYPAGSTGNVAPMAIIVGGATGLVYPTGIAVDSGGDIYVASHELGESFGSGTIILDSSINVYSAGSEGNAQPSAVILGVNTLLGDLQGVAVDSHRNVYAIDESSESSTQPGNAISVFAAGSNGNVYPAATIVGDITQLNGNNAITLDPAGNILVLNSAGGPDSNGSVTIYAAGSTGNAAPIDTVSSASTGMNFSGGIGLDSRGRIYVANGDGGADFAGSISIYPAGSYAVGAPLATITGDDTGLVFPVSVALDANDNIAVLDSFNTIYRYHAGSTGDALPRATLNIGRNVNTTPNGFTMGPDGTLYVANQGVVKCKGPNCHESTLGTIDVYSAGSRGNANPAATISGPDTNLAFPMSVAVSSNENIYVSNEGPPLCIRDCGCTSNGNGSITVYPPRSNGDAKPIATIKGPHTGLGFPGPIAVDSKGNIYVSADGIIGPHGGVFGIPCVDHQFVRTRSAIATRTRTNLTTDDETNGGDPILVFKAGSNGDVSPSAVIGGPFSQLDGVSGIAIGPTGR